MKNIDEKILMTEEIKQLQNKRKNSLASKNKKKEKKRDKWFYGKGAVTGTRKGTNTGKEE